MKEHHVVLFFSFYNIIHNLYIFFFEHELHESNEYILFKHGKFVSFEIFVFS